MDDKFVERLIKLRMQKGVSSREMSLSIGQSAGYINNIENNVNYPSMSIFFYICEYLNITPKDFFDYDVQYPGQLNGVINDLKGLSAEQLAHIAAIVKDLNKAK